MNDKIDINLIKILNLYYFDFHYLIKLDILELKSEKSLNLINLK